MFLEYAPAEQFSLTQVVAIFVFSSDLILQKEIRDVASVLKAFPNC